MKGAQKPQHNSNHQPRRIRRALIIAHDALWVPLAIAAAFWVRFNLGSIPADFWLPMLILAAVAIPAHMLTFWAFGAYRGVWRFASMPDLVRLSKAVAVGALITLAALFIYDRLAGVPRSVIFLYPLFLLGGTGGARAFYRALKEYHIHRREERGVQNVIVVGAGKNGEHVLRGLRVYTSLRPVGLVDDDPNKWGTEIYGVRVLGPTSQLAELCRRKRADQVIVAIPKPGRKTYSRILAQANEAGVHCQVSASMTEDEEGNGFGGLRPVTTEDVLGRDPVNLDDGAIAATVRNKTVLVTGGGGSIGLELCKRVLGHEPARLVVFDQSEYNLYEAEHALSMARSQAPIDFVLGDVCDQARVQALFRQKKPDIVLHAAAYKHVPMLESNVVEGVRNNTLGTRIIAEAAGHFGVRKFVLVSTDKTVHPTNVMGASKRAAELLCLSLQKRHPDTCYLITRFGNVLGSAGSVIPLFERQIREGGPVTVTHPEVKRFFMTIEEATGLIIQATALSRGGEVFVLEMGQPILIRELAENMIRLSGLTPGEDIKIVYTGLRPGEKLEEQLFYDTETLHGTGHSKLLLADNNDIAAGIEENVEALTSAALARSETGVLDALGRLVPEFNRRRDEAEPRHDQTLSDSPQDQAKLPTSLRVIK
ncbi:polysaccharide biosynthesis protein [Natronospira sp.]|uniref:polysaccharide biosynthesis protein n=1 Tax=Natronospira sp. TaxID=2024970 RepID=UPI00387395C5